MLPQIYVLSYSSYMEKHDAEQNPYLTIIRMKIYSIRALACPACQAQQTEQS